MAIEWDERKRAANLRKHGVDFADAVAVLEDENAIILEDIGHGEERFAIIGMDAFGRLVVVVYTYREDDTVRIISARKADKKEREQYGEKR